MTNPVLAEIVRGQQVKSFHRGSVAVVDPDGHPVLVLGDVERRIFPRSAVKALQALPLIESGSAERYGLTDAEIALACASHGGEPEHAATAALVLRKVGRDVSCLECGSHWPMAEKASRALAARGGSSALHNNCSGKHAGFVCLTCGLGEEPAGYVKFDHPLQQVVRRSLEEMTGATHNAEVAGTDGCSIPTYAVPLTALALGFAKFGTGIGMSKSGAAAAQTIRRAVAQNPFMVAGTGKFDTVLMESLGERAFVKVGAEGVYCATLPERGYGIALKIDDGGTRAAEAVMASLVRRFLSLDEKPANVVDALAAPVMKNWNGIEVGRMRPGPDL